MSGIKDLRQTLQIAETSFGGDIDGFTVIVNVDPSPADEREEIRKQSSSSAGGAKQPGLITKIERSVKAVGGAIGGAINMFAGE